MDNSERRADAAMRAVVRFDDPMAQYMSSIHASVAHPMVAMDDDDEQHAGSSSSRKRPSDDDPDHKHKRHKHKHHKHKEKHRKKKRHKEAHRRKKSRRTEKDKRTRSGRDSHSSSSGSDSSSGRGSDASNRSSAKHDRSSSPDIGPPLPPTGPEIGPPLPPPASATLAEAKEFRPTHEAFSSLGAVPVVERLLPTEAPGGGNGGASSASHVLRCLVCRVDAAGEASFIQHLCSRSHQEANQGRTGFAGLAPNSTGRIPPLVNHVLRAAATSLGMNPDGDPLSGGGGGGPAVGAESDEPRLPPWAPPSRSVHIPAAVQAEIEQVLTRTTAASAQPSSTALAAHDRPRHGRPSQHDDDDGLRRLYQARGLVVDGGTKPEVGQGGASTISKGTIIPSSKQSPRHKDADAAIAAQPPPRPPAAVRRRVLPPPPRAVAGGGPCAAVRQGLPVAQARAELLAALSEPACIVEGETGSGKT